MNRSKWGVFTFSVLLLLCLIIGRWLTAGMDFSYFISAGTDFVNPEKITSEIIVSEGQGYDGQFFYRLALDPFNYDKEVNGITLDFPAYRSQRIIYPLLVWIISAGGHPPLVPFSMVFVNILSFLGIVFFFNKISNLYKRNFKFQILLFALFGMYLCIAKDLSEVTELFFFTGAIWFMLNKRWWLFTLFSSLTLLTRETSVIALLPLSVYIIYHNKAAGLFLKFQLFVPFIILAGWKYFIHYETGMFNQFDGTGNFTLPFQGIIPGLKANLDISTTIKKLQLLFWIAYFLWQLWFIKIVISQMYAIKNTAQLRSNPFIWMYICWLIFAACLSESIYIDDWSFVRVFSLWNMTGLLFLASTNGLPGNRFYSYSALILFVTVIRLIIK